MINLAALKMRAKRTQEEKASSENAENEMRPSSKRSRSEKSEVEEKPRTFVPNHPPKKKGQMLTRLKERSLQKRRPACHTKVINTTCPTDTGVFNFKVNGSPCFTFGMENRNGFPKLRPEATQSENGGSQIFQQKKEPDCMETKLRRVDSTLNINMASICNVLVKPVDSYNDVEDDMQINIAPYVPDQAEPRIKFEVPVADIDAELSALFEKLSISSLTKQCEDDQAKSMLITSFGNDSSEARHSNPGCIEGIVEASRHTIREIPAGEKESSSTDTSKANLSSLFAENDDAAFILEVSALDEELSKLMSKLTLNDVEMKTDLQAVDGIAGEIGEKWQLLSQQHILAINKEEKACPKRKRTVSSFTDQLHQGDDFGHTEKCKRPCRDIPDNDAALVSSTAKRATKHHAKRKFAANKISFKGVGSSSSELQPLGYSLALGNNEQGSRTGVECVKHQVERNTSDDRASVGEEKDGRHDRETCQDVEVVGEERPIQAVSVVSESMKEMVLGEHGGIRDEMPQSSPIPVGEAKLEMCEEEVLSEECAPVKRECDIASDSNIIQLGDKPSVDNQRVSSNRDFTATTGQQLDGRGKKAARSKEWAEKFMRKLLGMAQRQKAAKGSNLEATEEDNNIRFSEIHKKCSKAKNSGHRYGSNGMQRNGDKSSLQGYKFGERGLHCKQHNTSKNYLGKKHKGRSENGKRFFI